MESDQIIGVQDMGKLSVRSERRVLTIEEVAAFLRVSVPAIEAEIQRGRLHAVRIGDEWRILNDDLEEFLRYKSPRPKELPASAAIEFSQATPFSYTWPDKHTHQYDSAFEGTGTANGMVRKILIGFGKSTKTGERRYAVVFVDGRPMVSFRTADDRRAGLMVSVIKIGDRKQLRPGDPIPPEYSNFRVESFRTHIDELHASKNMAVVCPADDLKTMAAHALIRASQIQERSERGHRGR